MGSVAKSNMKKGFLIYEETRKYSPIYEEAVSHVDDFATAPSEFPYIRGKFDFLFCQCDWGDNINSGIGLRSTLA